MNQTAAPNPEHLLQFWLILSLTFSTLVSVGTFVVLIINRKQKREVSFTEIPASKKEFDQFSAVTNANFVQVRDEMKKDRQDNQVHASERQKTLFVAVEKVRLELTEKHEELRTEIQRNFQDTERALGRIEGKIEGRL